MEAGERKLYRQQHHHHTTTTDEALLLSVGLTGLAEVGARWWLDAPGDVPKERAVDLLVGLTWRGISGFSA